MKQKLALITVVALSAAGFSSAEDGAQPAELIAGDVFSHFQPIRDWFLAGAVEAVPGKGELRCSGAGKILVNGKEKLRAPYLFTAGEFQDVEVHLEFMVPKDSNSGIYLMGRYEIQILDSFGKETPEYGDLGGLYCRWDESRKKAGEDPGFEGVPPRRNAARGPGEWQTFDILFRAPRFDGAGRKIENAKFVKVAVNGETVHENQEAKGPTRAHPLAGEVAKGPIAIQGDHGPIAIRSFTVKSVDLSGR